MKFKQKTITIFQLLFVLLFCTQIVQAQKTVDQIFTKKTTQVISLNHENLSAKSTQFNQSIDLGEYGTYNLSLEQTYLFSDDYMARRANKNNDDIKLPLTFKGTIQGQPNTLVSLTTSEDFLNGFIDTGEEVIFFEPYKNFNSSAEKNELIIYYQKDVIDQGQSCTANHTHQQTEQFTPLNDQSKSGAAGCYEVEMVLVADYGMYQKHGGNTLNHITSVLNNVKANYDNEFNHPIIFIVIDDYIATNSGMNLWSNTTIGNTLLGEFRTSNISSLTYDLASLWVSRDLRDYDQNGNLIDIAGIAYLPGTCSNFRYNLMEDFSSSSSSLRVAFAHEIGHNFDADHDPAGSGTIMAPAVNNTSTWSTKSKNEINAFYPNASCLCTSGPTSSCTDGIKNGNETGVDCGGSCPPCKPDLDITTCGTVSKSGNTIIVNNVVVKNIGTATAGSTALGCYLSTNTTIDNNDYWVGGYYTPSLAPNGSNTRSFTKDISTINPQIPAGTYYVGMIADYQKTLAESNENNNTCYDSSPRFTVTYGCKTATAHNYNPNATYADNTTCQTCSDGIKNGDETQVDCGGSKCSPCGNITVTKPGTGDTHARGSVMNIKWTDNISENVNIRMYKLNASSFYNLAPSTPSNGSFNYTIPTYIPDGQYRIYIKSVSNGSINDYGTYFTIQSAPSCTDGVQNGNETGIDCGGSCLPCKSDLDITTCGTVSKSGNTITVSNVVVKNIGKAATTPTRLAYYLSTNTTINNNDYLIGTDYVGSLAVNAKSTESISVNISTVTPKIPAGTYYVGMRADYQSVLAESNENNNTCYDSSPRFTVTYGCKTATAHNYNPNATYANNATCQTCSDGVKNGDETGVDCGGAKCGPCNIDLDITTCGTVSKSGNTITVSNVVVKNIGTATAASTRLGYYLSRNTTINNSDYLIGTDYVSSLAANGTSTEYISKNISTINPPIPAGTYYVGMRADYLSTLAESNENNNTCYDSSPRFTVTYGCKDPNAPNYDPNATYADNTTCQTSECDSEILSQIGSDFRGQNNQDFLGLNADLSADGSRVAIATMRYDHQSETNNGLVQVFDEINGNWVKVGNDIIGSNGRELGTQVSMSSDGKRIAVGHKFNLDYTTVYQLNGNVWSQLGNTIYSNSGEVKLSGDGNTLITSEWSDDTYGNNVGIVNVFEFNGSSWNAKGTVSRTTANSGGFGKAIDISSNGNRIAVKSYNNALSVAMVNIFQWNQSNRTWYPYGNTISGNDLSSQFGESIAMNGDGNIVAITGTQEKSTVYKFNGSGNVWQQVGGLIDNSFSLANWSKIDISGDGKIVLLSNPTEALNGNSNFGAVARYKLKNNQWNKIGNTIYGNANNRYLGINATMSKNGKVTIIAGYNSDVKGYAKVYKSECGSNPKIEQGQSIDTRNYPNPFTHHTTIEYTLAKDSPVTLTVYDASGKQIAVLHDNETRIKGTHTATFEGSLYPAGMYYYTIQAGEYFGTQKMILMK